MIGIPVASASPRHYTILTPQTWRIIVRDTSIRCGMWLGYGALVIVTVSKFYVSFTSSLLKPAARSQSGQSGAVVLGEHGPSGCSSQGFSWSPSNRYLNRSKLASTRLCNNHIIIGGRKQ